MKKSACHWNTLFLSLSLAACAGQEEPQSVKEAADDTVVTMGWEEFRQSAHQTSEGFFVVDGDIRLNSEQELREFYQENFNQGALLIDRPCANFLCTSRMDSKWSDSQKLNLTYCVSASGFGNSYDRVVDDMKSAAKAWESIIHVNFVHRSEFDGNCNESQGNVVFDVRPFSSQQFVATAFFPHQGRADRSLFIDLGLVDNGSQTLLGVLHHELGHALGFRHEHARLDMSSPALCVDDAPYRELTAYDSDSVMHYLQCGGTAGTGLSFSELDLAGAASVYGLPPVRIGHLDASGTLYVKEGGLDGAWVVQRDNVASFQLEGNRIGVLLQDGSVYVKEGALDEVWTWQGGNILKLQLEGNRIGLLENTGNLYVKEGGLDATWVREMDGISDFQLEGNRIGVLFASGLFYVKEGALDQTWVYQSDYVKKFQLHGRRIGMLEKDSTLYVREGSLGGVYSQIQGPSTLFLYRVADFQLENTRVALVEKGTNDLYVSERRMTSMMVFDKLFDAVAGFQLEKSRVAVLGAGGALYVKGGTLGESWQQVSSTVSAFQLYGSRIIAQDLWGGLFGMEGDLDPSWSQINGSNSKLQVTGLNLN